MTHNVIILGAGASAEAGIPVMSSFMETFWKLSVYETYKDQKISSQVLENLKDAMKISRQLDGYHGRAAFDDRNIEDILSLLSFDSLVNKDGSADKFDRFIKAIRDTIETTCAVKGPPRLDVFHQSPPGQYRRFWKHIIEHSMRRGTAMPTIISFNYDLVLERSLLEGIIGRFDKTELGRLLQKGKWDGIHIEYGHDHAKTAWYRIKTGTSDFQHPDLVLQPGKASNPLIIKLLKLHGSLNIPKDQPRSDITSLSEIVENPFILPPIYNKSSDAYSQSMWPLALGALRETKNVTIVGYSLPATDIYMQYFLKTGLGPNSQLNKITVFDPLFYQDSEAALRMRQRYMSCFSNQIHSRMVFNPSPQPLTHQEGRFEHFVDALGSPEGPLF